MNLLARDSQPDRGWVRCGWGRDERCFLPKSKNKNVFKLRKFFENDL